MTLGRLFDDVADLYDDVRPDYPDDLYAALQTVTGPLAGSRVLDLAAGPGTATRQLLARGADVVAVDPGLRLLRRLRTSTPTVTAVAAVAEQLPFGAGVVDVITCATAWHWFDVERAVAEVRRVLRAGGHLAVWWANNRHGDGIDWEDAQSAVYRRWKVERGSRAPNARGVDPSDVADDLRSRGLEIVLDRAFEWERVVDREAHLRLLRTHSDNLALGERIDDFVGEIAAALQPWPSVTERLSGPLVVARIA